MTTNRTRTAAAAVAALAALTLAACSSSTGSSSSASSSSSTGASPALSGTVTVFAAASLQGTFTDLGKKFEAAHPGTKVTFNFNGSSTLAQNIVQGAPADVFAAASPATMKTVSDAKDTASDPKVFVRNTLEIAVPKGNPKHIAALKDLAAPGVKVALCAPQVPCGAAALTALKAGNVSLTPVTQEQDVKSALNKVELGEVDASVVYHTDVQADAGKVAGVDFPEAAKAVNDYPIADLAKAPNPAAAKAFVAFVESAEGQQVLTAAGFQSPTAGGSAAPSSAASGSASASGASGSASAAPSTGATAS
ncbi:molybdate ABC transporter substrate-binding protein [Kitasatospora acidiphila]|uniref:Molybdate ABC transporter substrate-binding protein n=1 Tax=Kitasatospora acidiphila TaxID=2567942 RepID=A0A540VZY5_9ACTN|nr:molybdate ABC transporter substrate-binding protein [Kitasatospora acidiphila]TQF02301.1 molybdate ABC transporter substrate-binding protein [Kitasatospora acidiphila]